MKTLLSLSWLTLVLSSVLHARGDLDARSVTVNDTTPDPGDTVTVRWTAVNRTGDFIGSSSQGVMWSTNSTIDINDRILEREPLGPLGGLFADTSPETRVVRIPTSAVPGRSYWIGIYADVDLERREDNEGNNNSGAVRITIRQPNLIARDLTINDNNPDPGDLITVNWTAESVGDIPVGSSSQGVLLAGDTITTTLLEEEPLGALGGILFSTSPETRVVSIPSDLVPGVSYRIVVAADYRDKISESNENDNLSNTKSFTVRGPDFEVTGLEGNTQAFAAKSTTISTWPGDSINLEWTAKNTGNGASSLFDFSQQAIRWSDDETVDRNDPILEREPLGILLAGGASKELRTIKIPSDVEIGKTYYLAVEADVDEEFTEHSEFNNFSGPVAVTIVAPLAYHFADILDFSLHPDLEGGGLESDDPRLRDNTGDGEPDPGVTMSSSRCFNRTDEAYVSLVAAIDEDYATLLNGREDIRFSARWNTTPVLDGATEIGSLTLATGVGPQRFHLAWDFPDIPGNYYVHLTAEITIDGKWYEFANRWIDEPEMLEDPEEEWTSVVVNDALPVVLVHGWSDVKGETFGNLSLLIETLWERPVRFFHYETSNSVALGTGNGPRVDDPYQEIFGGEMKDSLAKQMETFLANPEGDDTVVERCDVVAHSMGGLVSRNYALREDKIRRLLTIGTPSYGGLFADTLIGDLLLNNQGEDLEAGSEVTWKLHREWSDPAVRESLPKCLAIVGTNDFGLGKYNQSDVVVPCSSASLEGLGFPVYYTPLGHSPAFSPIGVGAIASIEDTSHPSWAPLEAFLNTESGALPDNLPGHLGGIDDVGDKDHPDPLKNGAIYMVAVNGSGNPRAITAVNLGHHITDLAIETNGIHESGIFFASFVEADADSKGQRFHTEAESDVSLASESFDDQLIRVYAGQTTVLAIDGNNKIFPIGDLDGDGLPDSIEELIIAADPSDQLELHAEVPPDGDFDLDGLPEILEAALGTDSTTADHQLLSTELKDGFFYLRHRQYPSPFNLAVVCEMADGSLDGWGEEGVTGRDAESYGDGSILKEWSTPQTLDPAFLRLRAYSRDLE